MQLLSMPDAPSDPLSHPTPELLAMLREQIEGMDSIEAISEDMRALIEAHLPDLVSKLPPKSPS